MRQSASSGSFVGHVQPPACRAAAYPGAHHAVAPGDDKVAPVGVALVHLGQVGEVPPAAVVVRVVPEVVPAVVGRGGPGVVGSGVRVVRELVEVDAVRARVGKDAVEHYAYAHALGRGAEVLKVRVGAEDGVDVQVIRRVVAVVGAGLEHGVEVDDADTQALEVVEAALDALERAAVEVEREIKAVGAVGLPVHGLVPVLVVLDMPAHGAVLFNALARGVAPVPGEAVREDLIHYAPAEPGRGLEAPGIDREAEALAPGAHELAEAAALAGAEPVFPAGEADAEYVPERRGAPPAW